MNYDPQAMDEAAEVAEKELDVLRGDQPEAVEVVTAWFKANYMKAGYKRLGRIICGKSTYITSV